MRERFNLILENMPGGPPADVKVARLLKLAGRNLGLRAVSATEMGSPAKVGANDGVGAASSPHDAAGSERESL